MSTTVNQDSDLDRTDKLPILTEIEAGEFSDDAVRLEYTAVQPVLISETHIPEFVRPSPLDLPALAESVRTVEERIARQSAEYEALNRLYERARDAESASAARATAFAAELAHVSSAFAVEQHRLKEAERALAEHASTAESARGQLEEALRGIERHQSEARTLRDALATRDTTIVQVLHSLGERDAQLSALQREHAQIVPTLQARSERSAQLELELKGERERAATLSTELETARARVDALEAGRAPMEREITLARSAASAAQRQAETYLEVLRTHDWRRGFTLNLAREVDEKVAAASADRSALAAERDRLKQTAAALSTKVIDQEGVIARKQHEIGDLQRARADLVSRLTTLEADCLRLTGDLERRDGELVEARAEIAAVTQRVAERLAELEREHGEQRLRIEQLEGEAATHEEEMTVLLAHLNEARRPTAAFVADLKRLKDELVVKNLDIEQLQEENRELESALERARGALEEREFQIRRLEQSESKNANALGRLQTTIEKLGSTTGTTAPPPPVEECAAELVRLDQGAGAAHVLARRTRIGRAPGCELQIESSSVSRYHALLLKGPREVIIEDLNSTNGVIVNGRKISRQLLNDGDLLTIGEVKFRVAVKRPGQGVVRAAEPPAEPPATPSAPPAPTAPPA